MKVASVPSVPASSTLLVPLLAYTSPVISPVTSPVIVPDASIVVNVPAAAKLAPMIALSMLPPLMSAVSAIRLSIFAIPSMNKSLHS